jgi:hypothetical protein
VYFYEAPEIEHGVVVVKILKELKGVRGQIGIDKLEVQ